MTVFEPGTIVRALRESTARHIVVGGEYEVVEFRPAGSQSQTSWARIVLHGKPAYPGRRTRGGEVDIGHRADWFEVVAGGIPNY